MADLIINANIAIWSLQEIVRGNESKVYEHKADFGGCYYHWEGNPDCGVGQALALLGVPVETLAYMDACSPTGISEVHIPNVYMTTFARAVYERFQTSQDIHMPWGQALQMAKDVMVSPLRFRQAI